MTLPEALALGEAVTGRRDALLLLEKAAGLDFSTLRLALADAAANHSGESAILSAKATEAFHQMLAQRRQNVPVQYILGQWAFMGLPIRCGPAALIPRPDTETLAECALAFLQNLASGKPRRALDLCTGSGCVAIALAHLVPELHVTAVDICPQALALAAENAALNSVADRIRFVQADIFAEAPVAEGPFNFTTVAEAPVAEGPFNCITANPPYIPTADIAGLAPEVQQEPRIALDGGPDGLAFYRRIAASCEAHLAEGGGLFLEIGADQGPAVQALFPGGVIVQDLAGKDRVLCVSF